MPDNTKEEKEEKEVKKIKDAKEVKDKEKEDLRFEALVAKSAKFKRLAFKLVSTARQSNTGIVNLVVNYECPCLVDDFLKFAFPDTKEIYKETYSIDAVELQSGHPGGGFATEYLDALIFGSIEVETKGQGLEAIPVPKTDPKSGERKRAKDGFINRSEVVLEKAVDKLLIIKNVDYSLDFCEKEPGVIDSKSLWIFDKFRDPTKKRGCRLLLVSNAKLKLPFKVRTVTIDPVDMTEAKHIIKCTENLYALKEFKINFNDLQKKQIARKIIGLTYTEASDVLSEAIVSSREKSVSSKEIDTPTTVKLLREAVNRNLMQDAVGLSHLVPRPWEDYICPESSSFTYDVKKIMRDFNEITRLRVEDKKTIDNKGDDTKIIRDIDAIRSRMPHVIILYGKGGLGKSAFPVHFAGLLGFDIWDFNINASHSMWIGQGGERMREALARISKSSHSVFRIDEYDRAIGSGSASGSDMHHAHKQVEAEFMNWLQNCQEEGLFIKNDIFLVLTTNHKENITGPLLRSGRADLVIDISDFDDKSMRETFASASRRMKNRGVIVPIGFETFDSFANDISKLDLDKIVPLATQKGFTVRDVDTLLLEMAAHNYYFKRNGDGLPWNTETFIKVLEGSSGSTKDKDTGELVLGDRFLMQGDKKKEDPQTEFSFARDYSNRIDVEKFIDGNCFR